MNKIIALLLTCSLLIVGCGSKETNVKEDTTYKITWSENGNDHELTFTPNDYEKYIKNRW